MTRIIQGTSTGVSRWRLGVSGAVQGVGFRPFVYRLARELHLTGFVANNSQGAVIEIEGTAVQLTNFRSRLVSELPPRAFINEVNLRPAEPRGDQAFVIADSHVIGAKTALVLPDIATCTDCASEIFDPTNRRYLYPFTNCTNCGPRYSIIEALPYDRANTTMRIFAMCPECRQEYSNPANRRFHAQPNACPKCGPHVELWSREGKTLASQHEAIQAAAAEIKNGSIVALKGLGGFQLLVDAANGAAVRELRTRKRRSNKPFAVMYPSTAMIRRDCNLTQCEEYLVSSAESPIVIVERRSSGVLLSSHVAPGHPRLGVMLPYTPLHLILMRELNCPVVATSGNLSEEPLCIDEYEALNRLAGIADCFLIHNRPIKRHVDDSVARIIQGAPQLVRRARGYAPLPVIASDELPETIAVGGHLKNTIAVSKSRQIFISQHIGDLESVESVAAFQTTVKDLAALYELNPTCIAHDAHPDYASSTYAAKLPGSQIEVQHHYAHALSCLIDNHVETPAFGISWDGTGFGTDRTIWGGEFLALDEESFTRFAYLRPFLLPGGDAAIKEPRRSAAGILFELNSHSQDDWRNSLPVGTYSDSEADTIWQMLNQSINSPLTSSAGRLFDAVAAIVGFADKCSYEGEAASMLEFAIKETKTRECYHFELNQVKGGIEIDWRPMIIQILGDQQSKVPTPIIAQRFHDALVEMIVSVAQRARLRRVLLSGGCFMNKYLLDNAIRRLRQAGFVPYWHHQIPTNDGGIAVGQIMAAARAAGK